VRRKQWALIYRLECEAGQAASWLSVADPVRWIPGFGRRACRRKRIWESIDWTSCFSDSDAAAQRGMALKVDKKRVAARLPLCQDGCRREGAASISSDLQQAIDFLTLNKHPMNASHGQIQLDDGRRLGYAEYGDPKGKPMLYCHGLPASRLEAAFCDTAAKQLGIRIVAVDRPGYGLSDFQAQRLMSGWPDDVLQLTGILGIERFAVMGVSGGGPYALACAS
jgi:hypothetical protein